MWFRMVLTQILAQIYKDSLPLTCPSKIIIWLILQFWHSQIGSLIPLLMLITNTDIHSPICQINTGYNQPLHSRKGALDATSLTFLLTLVMMHELYTTSHRCEICGAELCIRTLSICPNGGSLVYSDYWTHLQKVVDLYILFLVITTPLKLISCTLQDFQHLWVVMTAVHYANL